MRPNDKVIDAYQAMKFAGELLDLTTTFDEYYIDLHSLWFDAGAAYVREIFGGYKKGWEN